MITKVQTARHTPGPWTLDPEYPDEIVAGKRSIGEVRGGRFVGDCEKPEYEVPAEVLANARLIAAAPELLTALESIKQLLTDKMLVRNTEGDHQSHWAMNQIPIVSALAQMEQAIKKARGEA